MKRPCADEHELTPDSCRFCWLYNNDEKHNRMWGGNGVLKPSVWKHAKTFVVAVAKHAAAGFKVVPLEVFEARMSECSKCPNYDAAGDSCRLCGCKLQLKARWVEQQCPDTPPKWTVYKAEEEKSNVSRN